MISLKCSDTMLIQPRWKVFDCQLQCVCDVEREINLVRIFFVSLSTGIRHEILTLVETALSLGSTDVT